MLIIGRKQKHKAIAVGTHTRHNTFTESQRDDGDDNTVAMVLV